MFTPPQQTTWQPRVYQKLRLYSKYNNLYFVAPSRWLYNCSKESLLTKNKPLFTIPESIRPVVVPLTDKPAAEIAEHRGGRNRHRLRGRNG